MYQRLESALNRWMDGTNARDKPSKGTLGYTVDGVYQVTVAENPAKYYVRFAEGNFAQVYHRGRVAPVPDLPVEVGMDSAGSAVILGSDPDRAGLFGGSHEVGPHSHARGSGMEFPIDLRLLTPIKAAPLTGLQVDVAQGAYLHGGSLCWWGGGAITLTPPASANQWRWTVIGIDPEANALVAVNGTALPVVAPLDPATLPALVTGGMIPLAAVRVRNGQTALDEDDFEDLRWPVGGRGASLIVVREEQAQNTSGGTFTSGAWRTRSLNTVASDGDHLASLSSSQITLPAGTYRLRATAPAAWVGVHQARWQNVSDGTTTLIGTSEFADTSAAAQTRSIVVGRFTITGSKTFELQHRCGTTRATDGLGTAGNFDTEVYAEVELWRE